MPSHFNLVVITPIYSRLLPTSPPDDVDTIPLDRFLHRLLDFVFMASSQCLNTDLRRYSDVFKAPLALIEYMSILVVCPNSTSWPYSCLFLRDSSPSLQDNHSLLSFHPIFVVFFPIQPSGAESPSAHLHSASRNHRPYSSSNSCSPVRPFPLSCPFSLQPQHNQHGQDVTSGENQGPIFYEGQGWCCFSYAASQV